VDPDYNWIADLDPFNVLDRNLPVTSVADPLHFCADADRIRFYFHADPDPSV